MSAEVDIVIIGSGVVGLAIASELAQDGRNVFVFEKNRTYGLETSSRNSQVIHGGLYYPENSFKAKLCVEGNRQLYSLCERTGIRCQKTGKVIIATSDEEIPALEKLYDQGKRNGVPLKRLTAKEIKALEPAVEGISGLFSASTGIIDNYSLMGFFLIQARQRGAEFLFNHEVTGIEHGIAGYKIYVKSEQEISALAAKVIINCAGLDAENVAKLAGIDTSKSGYRLHYCKGDYFYLNRRHRFEHLVYPVPEEAGLGIHVTPDIEGNIRLGPNVQYIEKINYEVDESHREPFYQAVKMFVPGLQLEDLEPDFAGVRPKLQGPGEGLRDFVISHETRLGLPGLINLIGIESPGLTASPAIARYVAEMVREILS